MLRFWRNSDSTTSVLDCESDVAGVELSERRFEKLVKALAAMPRTASRSRSMPRKSTHARVTMLPFRHGRSGKARQAIVCDISTTGLAVGVREPLANGTQFKILIPRRFRRALEVLCTARHCRPSGKGYIVGAEYGVSWLETLGTLVGPTPARMKISRQRENRRRFGSCIVLLDVSPLEAVQHG